MPQIITLRNVVWNGGTLTELWSKGAQRGQLIRDPH